MVTCEIENLIEADLSKYLANPSELGRVKRLEDARGRYIEFVKNSFARDKNLSGLKIVVDCANGASYSMAPTIFRELGAEVFEIGVEPNGFNINLDCGSTHPQVLQKKVIECQADLGIALDGDADRLLIVNEKGEIIDGDILIALIAEKLHQEGRLKSDIAVITQMSNLALEEYLGYIGVSTIRTKIGDRYVLEAMRKNKCNFGGEQSGHLVLADYSTTGDGLIASLQILSILIDQQKPLSEIAKIFKPYPQILQNVKFDKIDNPLHDQRIINFIAKKEIELGNQGRILVRKSGTENLIRVMVEGKNHQQIKEIANAICDEICNEINNEI